MEHRVALDVSGKMDTSTAWHTTACYWALGKSTALSRLCPSLLRKGNLSVGLTGPREMPAVRSYSGA